jgi:hypothetical protein
MLTSITPLGERGRNSRWGVTVGAFVIGSTVAGALLGGGLGGLGALLGPPSSTSSIRLLVLVGAALIGVALDLKLGGLRLPSVARQVNEDWMRSYRGWVYGFGFGFQLGLGFVTVVSASAVYLAFLAAALSGSPSLGALIGATFGFTRAAIIFATAGIDTPGALIALGAKLEHRRRPTAAIAIATQAVLALAALLVVAG